MDGAPVQAYGYEETLMHGKYTSSLRDFAQEYAKKLKYKVEEDEFSEKEQTDDFRSYSGENKPFRLSYHWKRIRPLLANDYSFLLILGVMMAVISFLLDYVIEKCQMAQILLYQMVQFSSIIQYLLWIGFPLLLITFSVGFVHLVSPHAIGSGIPEMKVILRGTILKRYLSFQTFIAKTIGLMAALGSGIPIGKEGPFVHISSMCARLLSKFIKGFQGIYINESRNTDMLACACALGVSSSFAAPIGGVLFSIEVTSTYFAVRNYWRGFFTAVCGAFMFRLLAVLDSEEETITALFKTNFRIDFPFDVQEFIAFGFIGLTCGLAGALFVYTHRKIVDVSHRNENSLMNRFLKKSRFIYPALIVLIVSTMSFPKGLGQFMAGQLTAREAMGDLFSNTTWAVPPTTDAAREVLSHWNTKYSNIYVTLVVFIIVKFMLTAVCVALPIPAGVFFPVFVIGAAYGRLVGECMATWFPDGVRTGNIISPVVPGGYAVVGAAAMAGAVTHTISTSVIVFELTGQITHILPVMVAVLIANAVVQQLQPSIYDSIIDIKKLPNLPDIKQSRSLSLNVGDIMNTRVFFISAKSTYVELKKLLQKARISSFALVDSPESMILLGSVRRFQLEWMLDRQLSKGQTGSQPESDLSIDMRTKDKPVTFSCDSTEESVTLPEFKPGGGRHYRKAIAQRIHGAPSALQKLFASSTEASEAITSSEEYVEEQCPAWELELLQEEVDFTDCNIDPSPFQLVQQTSLYKVHKLFSLLNLSHAYVTSIGRLIGVVSLREVRQAIENEQTFIARRRSVRGRSRTTGIVESGDESQRSSDIGYARSNSDPVSPSYRS